MVFQIINATKISYSHSSDEYMHHPNVYYEYLLNPAVQITISIAILTHNLLTFAPYYELKKEICQREFYHYE